MTTIAELTLVCPCCALKFKSQTLMSTNQMGMATDFMPLTAGASFIPLLIHTCPTCGYSGGQDDFGSEHEVSEEIKERVFAELRPHLTGQHISPPRGYWHAALILEWHAAPILAVADMYLKAAWCCRIGCVNDTARDEEYFLRQALERFERALGTEIVLDEHAAQITYLVGELHRRVGEREIAAKWFDRVVPLAGGNDKLKWLTTAAQQQKRKPKDVFE
jgi:uncharacterized protein (DUF2225 family)